MRFKEPGPPDNTEKDRKIKELRQAIARAEEQEDEEAVLILEAELRAVEQGQTFDKRSFLASRSTAKVKTKRGVLRDMKEGSPSVENDQWFIDGILHEGIISTYEKTFRNFLDQLGVKTFSELARRKSIELGRGIRVVDLFGGAYFLTDLDNVFKIVGVRLKNTDQAFLNNYLGAQRKVEPGTDERKIIDGMLKKLRILTGNKKRKIIEGDLLSGRTWRTIKSEFSDERNPGADLVICRPAALFWIPSKGRNAMVQREEQEKGTVREEVFITLFERALKLLSQENGLLFTEIPELRTNSETEAKFWEKYVTQKREEGYKFSFSEDANHTRNTR